MAKLDQGEFNIFKYRNFYNGGGVAIADFNNDSLGDIYLISNMFSDISHLNPGFVFSVVFFTSNFDNIQHISIVVI